ncbi:autotransporter-associated beta strand repeat-containing protein, partial [Brucella sp. TWI432]
MGHSLHVVNSGTITAGKGGTSQNNGMAGADGYAIWFDSGVNSLELQSGSKINGDVVAHGTNNVFILGGDLNDTFAADVTSELSGTEQYRGFSSNIKDGASVWSLTGNSANWMIKKGVLQIGNGGTAGSIEGGVNTGTDATNNGMLGFNRMDTISFRGIISGTGGVLQAGTGTTVLTANNTYTGGTNFNSGKLSVSSDNNLGEASGALRFDGGILKITGTYMNTTSRNIEWDADGGGFDIDETSNTFTLNQNLGAGGALTKLGDGTLVLSGTNLYKGGTNINAGTLSVSSDSNLGDASGGLNFSGGTLKITNTMISARDITLTSNSGGTISVDGSKTATFSGVFKNAGAAKGAFTKAGNGTLVLTASNSYTGGTTVSGGILQLGDGTTDGSIMGDIALDGGNLVVDDTGATPLSGAITGTGSVTQNGAGTLTLSGNNGYGDTFFNAGVVSVEQEENLGIGALNFDGGTLQITGTHFNDTTKTIVWGDHGGGFDIVDPTNTFTITSAFTGSGQLAKKGAGTLALTGDSSVFQGNTLVKDGTLRLDGGKLGDGTGTVDVASGAALGGHGSIGGNTTVEGTLLAQSGQVLTFSKDLTLNAGSNVDVTLNGGPSMSELFHVNGNLTIDGTLTV